MKVKHGRLMQPCVATIRKKAAQQSQHAKLGSFNAFSLAHLLWRHVGDAGMA